MDGGSSVAGLWNDQEGDVAVLDEGDHTLVILYGRVDVRCADDLEQAGRFAIDAARWTVVDVKHVTQLDSVGLSFVVRLAAGLRAAGVELFVRGAAESVRDLLALVGADDLVRWVQADGREQV